MSLGVLRVAACLEKAGHVVEVLDLSGLDNFEEAVRSHAAQTSATVFGFTSTTPQLPAVARLVAVLREIRPTAKLILGGPHVTLVHAAARRERKKNLKGRGVPALDKLASLFDVLVVGDGEDAIFEAIREDAPKLVDGDNPNGSLFMSDKRLEETPWPARHLVDVRSYHYRIEDAAALSMICQLGCPFPLQFLRGAQLANAAADTFALHGKHHCRTAASPPDLWRSRRDVL